ncbi:MAG: HD domain-containing protein [Gammaproteobacteria bacterium]|nr:HD domain-containing protein [Gammaproteobacteria bacterium]
MDLVERAREYAINAHKRIDHRRKYSQHPYSVHLAAVAKLVSSVTEDPELIAAAWLHDVVEDTSATLYDIEVEFGKSVAALVEDLTDVSKPSDGNRPTRKAIDRQHLAQAVPGAMTVKLADLIDNCQDICKNDKRFARVFLEEMDPLLNVLQEGDATLYELAQKTYAKCWRDLEKNAEAAKPEQKPVGFFATRLETKHHLVRHFTESFTAQDIAEPVHSFDIDKPCKDIRPLMDKQHLDIVCLRNNGKITGYVRRSDLNEGCCGDHLRPFRQGQVLASDSSLSDIIHVLTLHQYGFIRLFDDVVGYVSRSEINKPVVRMWLFGIITFIEMEFSQMIQEFYPDQSWRSMLTEKRLAKAVELQEERLRRNQHCDLIDCLQLSDKGQIVIQNPEFLELLDIGSKSVAKRLARELESLRNNLAHSQDIVTHDWGQIVRLSYRLEETFSIKRANSQQTD